MTPDDIAEKAKEVKIKEYTIADYYEGTYIDEEAYPKKEMDRYIKCLLEEIERLKKENNKYKDHIQCITGKSGIELFRGLDEAKGRIAELEKENKLMKHRLDGRDRRNARIYGDIFLQEKNKVLEAENKKLIDFLIGLKSSRPTLLLKIDSLLNSLRKSDGTDKDTKLSVESEQSEYLSAKSSDSQEGKVIDNYCKTCGKNHGMNEMVFKEGTRKED